MPDNPIISRTLQKEEHSVAQCSSLWLPPWNILAEFTGRVSTEGPMEQVGEDLNLSYLLEHERDMILKVLQKDEKLRKREEKRIRWGLQHLHLNSCSSRSEFSSVFSPFCSTGSWKMSCWRSNERVPVGPMSWGNDSAPAAWRRWDWYSTAEISARSVSCESAMTAALKLPTAASGGATFVPRSCKCDVCRSGLQMVWIRWLMTPHLSLLVCGGVRCFSAPLEDWFTHFTADIRTRHSRKRCN